MKKESPVKIREMLKIAKTMVNSGIGFVPVPYTTQLEKDNLVAYMKYQIDKLDGEHNE